MKHSFNSDPKSFYKFVNSKKKSGGFPKTMKYGANESSDDHIISNLFADFFSTTYSDSQYDANEYPHPIAGHQIIHFSPIHTNQILDSLKSVKSSYHTGPDGVPSCVLKNCAHAIATPLSIIFNISLKYGYFPQSWKDSFIIPLFKSGSKSCVTNYRGIAKLSAIPKLFEKCVTDNLLHQISSLLSSCQHGFSKGRSTVTNLMQLTTIVNRGFMKSKFTDCIYTDFSKAFDKVNHKLLLLKLHAMGLTHGSLNWIKSYLTNRKQNVIFNNTTSKNIIVSSGVPQGSHIGPILFSLFINDLPCVIKYCNVLMYADDVKIFHSYDNNIEQNLLQHDLDELFKWCVLNLMELNLKKCKHMRFSRKDNALLNFTLGGHQLELVTEFSDLGVLLDPKLNFKKHIYMMVNKARGVLAFIKRWAKEFTEPIITKRLYTSLVRPILEYGSVIWDPDADYLKNIIESVQKQFLLFCLGNSTWNPNVIIPPYTTRLALIKLPTLESRRTMLSVSFLFNLINGAVCSNFLLSNINFNVPHRSTRFYIPIYLQVIQTNYANSDSLRKLCKLYNNFYFLIDYSVNVNTIKRNITLYLNQCN